MFPAGYYTKGYFTGSYYVPRLGTFANILAALLGTSFVLLFWPNAPVRTRMVPSDDRTLVVPPRMGGGG